jgi:hypothetical protein
MLRPGEGCTGVAASRGGQGSETRGDTAMTGWAGSGGSIGEWTVPAGGSATRPRRTAPRRLGHRLVAVGFVALLMPSAAAQAGDRPTPTAPSMANEGPAITLEVPHPSLLIDRLSDPRIQQSLRLSSQYRKFRDGPQFRQIQAVAMLIAGQLHTTWDRALRDLTGGGIVATVSADPGRDPRLELVVTSRDPKLLERLNEVFLKMARKDARDKKMPDPVRTTDYRGTVLHVLGGDKVAAYAIVSGRLAVANSIKDLERVVDRLRADARTSVPTDRQGPMARDDAHVILRGHVDVERLKKLDPKKYTLPARPNTGVVFLFGSWYEALKRARSLDAAIRWSETELSADVDLGLPGDARPASVQGFVPGLQQGALSPLRPPGTIASLSLWRDWATIWESRADLLAPEVVQGLAQFDTLAGQFFGGREFGSDVLGAFDPHWRLVVAQQDHASMKPAPDLKLPAFAIVAELNGSQEDFAARLKIAFQSIVAISNVESAQKKGPVFELGSEVVEGITIATTKYLVPRRAESASEPGATRYNYSPSIAQVGRYFIFSSSTGLARSLVEELKAGTAPGKDRKDEPATFTVEADGPELARLLDQNRSRMVMQTMLGQGETKQDAERRAGQIVDLVRYLGHGRLVVADTADRTRLELKLDLKK